MGQTSNVLPEIETEIRTRYFSMRLGVPDEMPITVLHIGAEQAIIAYGKGNEPEAIIALDIGSQKTPADYFKHNPPTPEELEKAIMTVEDEVARARTTIAEDPALLTNDEVVREIARVAGITDRPVMILPLETIERTFDRLAAVTLGRPASHEGLPTSTAFAATLLILREFMHHMKFSSITIRS